MKELFKNAFLLLKNNAVILQPLLIGYIFLILAGSGLFSGEKNGFNDLFSGMVFFLTFCALCAGWCACIKHTVDTRFEEQNGKHQIEILKHFFPGVTEYFLPVIFSGCLYVFVFITGAIVTIGGIVYCLDKISSPVQLKNLMNAGGDLNAFLSSNISNPAVLKSILFLLGLVTLYSFIFSVVMLWFVPALFYKSKNPFVAFVDSLKFFKNRLKDSVIIVLTMYAINFAISALNIVTGNGWLSFVPFLLMFFYFAFYALTVFLYYAQAKDNYDIGSDGNG